MIRFDTKKDYELYNSKIEDNAKLQQENQQLKKEYNKVVHEATEFESKVYELQQENQELKKQLTTYQILHRDCKIDNLKNISKIEEMENQQKEFIEYLENCINELKKESMNKLQNAINLGIVDITKEILSKYKEIIGGK